MNVDSLGQFQTRVRTYVGTSVFTNRNSVVPHPKDDTHFREEAATTISDQHHSFIKFPLRNFQRNCH